MRILERLVSDSFAKPNMICVAKLSLQPLDRMAELGEPGIGSAVEDGCPRRIAELGLR